jgi:hypothetical protein
MASLVRARAVSSSASTEVGVSTPIRCAPREHAKSLGGYDVANSGAVIFNARR